MSAAEMIGLLAAVLFPICGVCYWLGTLQGKVNEQGKQMVAHTEQQQQEVEDIHLRLKTVEKKQTVDSISIAEIKKDITHILDGQKSMGQKVDTLLNAFISGAGNKSLTDTNH